MNTFIFFIYNYLIFFFVVFSAYGAGQTCLKSDSGFISVNKPIFFSLSVTIGLGIMMMCFFVLGTFGIFNKTTVGLFLIAMSLLSLKNISISDLKEEAIEYISATFWEKRFLFIVIVIALLPFFIKPFCIPIDWDELMYHLPYAHLWAIKGKLAVNQYLRYPFFPYNFDLLYSAALLFGNDILPHFLHALSGGLTAISVYFAVQKHHDKLTAICAVVMLILSIKWGFRNAFIDLGLTLFIFQSFFCIFIWLESPNNKNTLFLAVFFAAIAVGIKYTALFYMPIGLMFILYKERNPKRLIQIILLFSLCGGYWYIRNYILSGNPIHPFGGRLFGYWLWDANDIAGQLYDLTVRKKSIPWYLIPSLFGFFYIRKGDIFFQGMCIVTYVIFGIWISTPQVSRYLTPIYPMMSYLSAIVTIKSLKKLNLSNLHIPKNIIIKIKPVAKAIMITVVIITSAKSIIKDSKLIIPDSQKRHLFLIKELPGYELLSNINIKDNERIFQFGFENEIYYLPENTIGDWFGPGRYSTVFDLAANQNELIKHLNSLEVKYFLHNKQRQPFSDINLGNNFELIGATKRAALYRLKFEAYN